MSKLVSIKTYEVFKSLWDNDNINELSLNFIVDTQQLYTHGMFINSATFGTESSNTIPLTIAGVSKTLALSGHTHSNYYDKTANLDIGNYSIVSGNNELLKATGGSLYLGNVSNPTYISGNHLYSIRGQNTYTILDTGNFEVTNKDSNGYTYYNKAIIKYGTSFEIDYVKRDNSLTSLDNLHNYTSAGTTKVNNVTYGFITLRTDTEFSNPSWAQLRIDIPGQTVQFRTSANPDNWKDITVPIINQNALNVAGIVKAPSSSTTNKVWKTDENGNPDWRDDSNSLYSLTLNGTTKGNTGGTDLGTFYAIATSDASDKDQVWMRNSDNTAYGWRTLGSHAFDSTDYLPLDGGTLTGKLTISTSTYASQLTIKRTTSGNVDAVIGYENNNGFLGLIGVSYQKKPYFSPDNGNTVEWIWTSGNDGSGSDLDADLLDGQHGSYYATASSLSNYLPLSGGTMSLGEGLKFHSDDNYFGENFDARIISLLDGNDTKCDGGLIIDERATSDGTETITELLRIRHDEFKWKGQTIYHSGNLPAYPTLSSLGIKSRYVTLNGEAYTYYSPYDQAQYTGAAFYAPTTAGTQHYILESNGSGAPTWTNSPIFSGKVTIQTTSWGNQLILNRTSSTSTWGPSILFNYDGTNKGAISMDSFDLYVGDSGSYRYKVLNESNYTNWVYSKSDSDDRYVNVTGDTMTGKLTIKTTSYRDQLTIYRNENHNNCVINFENKDGVLGAIGFTGLGQTGMAEMAHIIDKAGNLYPIFHSGNYTTWINTTNFPGLFSVNTDSEVEQHNMSGEGYTNLRPLLFGDTSHASAPSSFASVTARTYFTPNIYGQPEYGNLFLSGKITAGSGDFTGNVILGTSGSGATPYLGFKRGTWENSGANDWRVYCTSGDLYFDVYSASPSDGWHTVMRIADNYNLYVNGSTVYHSGNLTYGTLGLNTRTVSLNGTGYTYISPYRDATTSAGTSDYILKSNGSGAPSWTNSPTLTGNLTLYSASGNTPQLRFQRGVWEDNSVYDWRVYCAGGELYFDVYDLNGWNTSFKMGISDTSYNTYIHGNLVYHSGNLPDIYKVNITIADSGYTDYRPMVTSDSTSTSSIDPSFSGGNHKLLASNKIYFSPGTGNMATQGNIKLYTSGTGATPAIIFQRRNDSDTTYNDWKIYGSSGYFYIDLNYNGSWRNAIWIHENGSIYASNYYTTSDRAKKQNISSFSEHIRKFQLKDTEKWHYGVIAQEVPEMFREGEEGNMTVNYNSVLSYYVGRLENSVADLEDAKRQLENRVKELENEIQKLKSK